MFWAWFSIILLLALLGFMFITFMRDRKFLHKRSYETMSPALREELDEELEKAVMRKQKFDSKLKEAMQDSEKDINEDDIPTKHA